jgi:uncharacterized protein (TIGR00369 family)
MPLIELPHTHGCLVCGRDNPHGLHLSSLVDPDSGSVQATFTPAAHHIGFENIIHGGVLATLLDELMVWSAIWASGKACVAAEMSLRFLQKAGVGQPLDAVATVTRQRSRLIETASTIHHQDNLICTAMGKYVPLGTVETEAFFKTFAASPGTVQTEQILKAHLVTGVAASAATGGG